MSAESSDPPALRASDADRDRVIDALRTAVTDGRLDPDEFDERLGAALAARTLDALTPLTADLVALPGREVAVLPAAAVPVRPTGPAAQALTIKEKHGTVRRDGDWVLPQRLALRTAWSMVTLDLTSAVRSGPELVIDVKVSGGNVELILAPGMVVDANELTVRHGQLEINRDPDDATPQTLRVRLVGGMKHGRIEARWSAPRAA